MSISSISSLMNPSSIQNWQAMMSQQQQDFQSLASSLQSGNLSGAQQAYSELQATASASGSNTSPVSGSGPCQQDFTALGQDLSSGNLSQAQQQFAQMKTDFQSALSQNGGVQGMHHHGHHGHKTEASSADSESSTTTTDPILSNSTSSLLSQYASINAANNSTASSLLSMLG